MNTNYKETSILNHICVITNNYPDQRFIERGSFVEKLVRDWKELNMKVDIIAPRSIPNVIRSLKRKKHHIKIAGDRIERPLYITVSNKKFGKCDLHEISRRSFVSSVTACTKEFQVPDLYYGKFLMSGGLAASLAGRLHSRPAFADLGESMLLDLLNEREKVIALNLFETLNGLICVSQRLIDEVVQLGADPDKVLYAPNTVDKFFRPMDKSKCRKKLGLPEDDFIVAFTGHFISRKGPNRVLKAINQLDLPIKGMFFGSGEEVPKGNKVLFTGAVPNRQLPEWLNAADIFVLPTLAEGHCNAINEAMACGLPIISSDIPDIRSQVPESAGILVDPLDLNQLALAIKTLFKDQEKRIEFQKGALYAAEIFQNERRSMRIINWMKNIVS